MIRLCADCGRAYTGQSCDHGRSGVVWVRCVGNGCGVERAIAAGEHVPDGVPTCPSCSNVMVPVRADARLLNG